MDALTNITGWTFLNEPVYRWFLFFGAAILMLGAWKDILDWMR